MAQFYTYHCSRLLGVQLSYNEESLLFVNVYMLYQSDDNFEIFMEYIGKITALIDKSSTRNIAFIGDFNVAIDTHFDVELQEMCSN